MAEFESIKSSSFVGKEQSIPIHNLLKYCIKSISDQYLFYSFQANITHALWYKQVVLQER